MTGQRTAKAAVSARPPDQSIDLSASAARVASARHLAAQQARMIAASSPRPTKHAIDLMFLFEDSVLVFEETHAMLRQLARHESKREQVITIKVRRDFVPKARHGHILRLARSSLVAAAQIVALIMSTAYLIEWLDPNTTSVSAAGLHRGAPIEPARSLLDR